MTKAMCPLLMMIGAMTVSLPAIAQDSVTGTNEATGATAPDGTKAFGIEPYFGILGGWEQFDNEATRADVPQALNPDGSVRRDYKLAGALVQGIAGVNVPLGPTFVGVEGNAAKGVKGNIDWEYGVAGRFGLRAGDSGLFYGKVGYQWVNFDHFSSRSTPAANLKRDFHDVSYGVGFEVGPKDIGLKGVTGNAGFRLRGEVSTFGEAHSFRPMLGIVSHF